MSNRLVLTVWTWLLILTGVEVFLAYKQVGLALMLILLMGFSIVKAALIVAYFMHLRFEKREFNSNTDAGIDSNHIFNGCLFCR